MGDIAKTATQRIFFPPFAVDQDVKKSIPESLELAAVFRLAEKGRAKKTLGIRKIEKIEFMAKSLYPIWSVKINEGIAFIDPLGAHSTTLKLTEHPFVEEFTQQVEGAQSNLDMFLNIVSMYQKTFSEQSSVRTRTIKGLVDRRTAEGLLEYFESVESTDLIPECSTPLLDEVKDADTEKVVRNLRETRHILNDELDRLGLALSILDRTTHRYMADIQAEIKEIEDEYSRQFLATREMVETSIEELRRRRSSEIDMVTSRFSEAKEVLSSSLSGYRMLLVAFEKEQEIITRLLYRRKETGLGRTTRLWKELANDLPKRIEEVGIEVGKIRKIMDTVEEERIRELTSIEAAYDDLIRSKRKILTDSEIDREIEIRKKKEQIEELDDKTTRLRNQILLSLEKARTEAERPRWLLSELSEYPDRAILKVPFYLICFGSIRGGRRFAALSPCIFKGTYATLTLGWKVFEERLIPFSRELAELFQQKFIVKLNGDPVLRHDVYRRIKPQDLLRSTEARNKILEGLDLFYKKGWLHFSSVASLKNALREYASES